MNYLNDFRSNNKIELFQWINTVIYANKKEQGSTKKCVQNLTIESKAIFESYSY